MQRGAGDPRHAARSARVHAHRIRGARTGLTRFAQSAEGERERAGARAGGRLGLDQDGRRHAARARRRRLDVALPRRRRTLRCERSLRGHALQRGNGDSRRAASAHRALSFARAAARARDRRRNARHRERGRLPHGHRRASRFAAAHVRRVLRHGRRPHRARALRRTGRNEQYWGAKPRLGRVRFALGESTAAADEESAA